LLHIETMDTISSLRTSQNTSILGCPNKPYNNHA
jgi:hypothetical protein